MPQLDIKQIQSLLYHRYPFLMIDRVIDYEPGLKGVGIKNITINEPYFQGHFPGQPVMPGVLMIEAVAQLCAIVLGTALESKDIDDRKIMGYFASVKNFKFKQTVVPGDQLKISIEFLDRRQRIYIAHGIVEIIDGKLAAEGDVMFALMNREPI